jgi:hypothetical protein
MKRIDNENHSSYNQDGNENHYHGTETYKYIILMGATYVSTIFRTLSNKIYGTLG